jgi:hypothetical protein
MQQQRSSDTAAAERNAHAPLPLAPSKWPAPAPAPACPALALTQTLTVEDVACHGVADHAHLEEMEERRGEGQCSMESGVTNAPACKPAWGHGQ